MKLTRLQLSAATFAALTTLSLFGCGGGGDTNSSSVGALNATSTYRNASESGASMSLIYEVKLTPSGGFNQTVRNLTASNAASNGLPASTTYAIAPTTIDASRGEQTITLTIAIREEFRNTAPFTVRLSGIQADGSTLTMDVAVSIPNFN